MLTFCTAYSVLRIVCVSYVSSLILQQPSESMLFPLHQRKERDPGLGGCEKLTQATTLTIGSVVWMKSQLAIPYLEVIPVHSNVTI